MSSRVLNLRRGDTCRVCGAALAAGTPAYWNATRRTVICLGCFALSPVGRAARVERSAKPDRGRAGASAEREHARRRRERETATRRAHPWIGGLLLTFGRPPAHETSYRKGAEGERSVAAFLERRTAKTGAVLLNDRAMPRSRSNIDHLAIAAGGVYVIDTKNVSGEVRVIRPLFGKRRLRVAGRDRSKFVAGLDRQTAAVRSALGSLGQADVPVHGILCFGPEAELPLLGGSRVNGHRLCHRRALARELNRSGPLTREQVGALARKLGTAFPPR